MSRTRWVRGWAGGGILGLAAWAALVAVPLPGEVPAAAQPPAGGELPVELRYVPADAALFVHADAAALWASPIFQAVRKADAKLFDDLIGMGKDAFGLTPDDVKTVVAFVPKLKQPGDTERFGVAVTFKKAYDKDKIAKGAEKLLPKNVKVNVVAVSDRTALVLVNLEDEYAKPQPAGATGPLSAALKEAATGKHAAVAGVTLASLPDQLQADDLPAQVRPFQPLLKAISATATLDLGKTIDLDVRIKTGTAGQAIECEKSLGVLLSLIQTTLGDGIKELGDGKDPALKDLVALMNAGIDAAKRAKFATLGNEARVTVSLPADLPFATAYLAAKQKVEDAAAVAKSANNLKQIAIAMHNYADTLGTMPPAAVCDKAGTPLLSWRVLILPYIEQEQLYKEFKLDEAWDSEHNKKLLAKMPKVYAIPGKTKPDGTDTYYRVFVGNGAGFDWVRGARFPAEFPDGTSNTLMCVTATEAVPWTKPDELEFNPDKDMTRLIGMVVNGKAQVSLFDGSVRTLSKLPSKATVHALITRAGGEVIGNDFP
jgi:Protein of unknown function (DUF1559)